MRLADGHVVEMPIAGAGDLLGQRVLVDIQEQGERGQVIGTHDVLDGRPGVRVEQLLGDQPYEAVPLGAPRVRRGREGEHGNEDHGGQQRDVRSWRILPLEPFGGREHQR